MHLSGVRQLPSLLIGDGSSDELTHLHLKMLPPNLDPNPNARELFHSPACGPFPTFPDLLLQVTKFRTAAEVEEKPQFGCYVQGLYLEGAAWDLDRSMLRRQDPKVLVEELPVLQIIPMEASKLKLSNTFKAPVYITQSRRNAAGAGLVFEADLATGESSVLMCCESDVLRCVGGRNPGECSGECRVAPHT